MRPLHAVPPLLLAALLCACAARVQRESVFFEGRTEIELRHETRRGQVLPKGYAHPAMISPTRVANVLAAIEIRKGGKDERQPAIPSETLYTIAKGVSQALAKANPDQELAVLSIRSSKRFGIFDRNYLTSFVCYVKGEQLYLHLSRSEWEIPRDKTAQIPWPSIGDSAMPLRVLPARGLSLIDDRSVAADWRSDSFSRTRNVRVGKGGKVKRRTVLMESPDLDAADVSAAPPLPPDLPPQVLRALADLEEQRRQGVITEAFYQAKRSELVRPYEKR